MFAVKWTIGEKSGIQCVGAPKHVCDREAKRLNRVYAGITKHSVVKISTNSSVAQNKLDKH